MRNGKDMKTGSLCKGVLHSPLCSGLAARAYGSVTRFPQRRHGSQLLHACPHARANRDFHSTAALSCAALSVASCLAMTLTKAHSAHVNQCASLEQRRAWPALQMNETSALAVHAQESRQRSTWQSNRELERTWLGLDEKCTNGPQHLGNGHGWAPLLCQDVQADCSTFINVAVVDAGAKHHLFDNHERDSDPQKQKNGKWDASCHGMQVIE
jgi:hypothetical protein